DRAAHDHDRLADVNELAGAFANDVHTQHLPCVAVKDELEAPSCVSADLAARSFAVEGHANFVGDILIGKLFFGLADEADVGDRVDGVWIKARIGCRVRVGEGPSGGDSALLHGDGGKGREANDVADCVDVLDLGLVVFVDGDAAAIVGFDAGGCKVKIF